MLNHVILIQDYFIFNEYHTELVKCIVFALCIQVGVY